MTGDKRQLPERLQCVTPDVGKLIDEAIAWAREGCAIEVSSAPSQCLFTPPVAPHQPPPRH